MTGLWMIKSFMEVEDENIIHKTVKKAEQQ